MLKKITLFIVVILFIISCKKDNSQPKGNNQPQLLDVTGSWTLNSDSDFAVLLEASQYPCIANNVTTFNNDGTAKYKFTGSVACYISVNNTNVIGIGMPGDSATFKWTRSGNTIRLNGIYGILGNVNGQLRLTTIDTIAATQYNSMIINTEVYIKE